MEIKSNLTPAQVQFNEADLVAFISDFIGMYENFVVTDENFVDTKKDIANINKFIDELETTRKKIKKEILKPYEDFEKIIKREEERVQACRANLNGQVQGIIERDRRIKLVEVEKLIKEVLDGKNLQIDVPINEKWLNKSTKLESVRQQVENIAMEHQLTQINGSNLHERTVKLTYEEKHRQTLKNLFTELEAQGIKYQIL